MLNIMDSYYSNMKEDMGIFQKDNRELLEDQKLEETLKKLKPNTNAKNFRDFLHKKENINRSSYWKNVARKLEDSEKFMNRRNNHT